MDAETGAIMMERTTGIDMADLITGKSQRLLAGQVLYLTRSRKPADHETF
jgi:uncharacterized membrane protein (UPF0136 family)